MHKRINIVLFLITFALLFSSNAYSKNDVHAVRIWPAQEYTRITIESTEALNNDQMILKNPERVVIDLKGIALNDALKILPTELSENDPNINAIRVAQFNPNVTRIVIDLRNPARVKIFSLQPIAPYKHRLVIDLYPENHDSIANLLKQIQKKDEESPSLAAEVAPSNNVESEGNASQNDTKSDTVIVAIDPGHGGEDPGAKGKKGTLEKDITLQISKKLKEIIDKEDGMRAVLIREGDYYVPLGDRVKKARKIKADIFISIHADAFTKRSVTGSSVFALSERGATSAFAKFLANKENESDLIGGVSIDDKDALLAKTLLDLSQSATVHDSIKLGNHVLGQIKNVNNLHKKYVEQAGFAVLKAPDIPSILVETAFISNPAEEQNLKSSAYQDKLAMSILEGIKSYIKTKPSIAHNTD
ncbi:MAG TPA: N-acetylmuramoyl-L-alanine amidase [Methylophilaceae bacterium]|jgi:N-acetylmuramoyl-L-alanine amidase|nr:N-acetylmuramoyl-L-alanine amidase [Methylophilaceae bacterium]